MAAEYMYVGILCGAVLALFIMYLNVRKKARRDILRAQALDFLRDGDLITVQENDEKTPLATQFTSWLRRFIIPARTQKGTEHPWSWMIKFCREGERIQEQGTTVVWIMRHDKTWHRAKSGSAVRIVPRGFVRMFINETDSDAKRN